MVFDLTGLPDSKVQSEAIVLNKSVRVYRTKL